ncbi:MAG: 4-phosphoerythronate dehydrogenase [Agarilytica sp.]
MNKDISMVADENIPYVKELFSPIGEVSLVSGRHVNSADVKEANVLLVRSVTNVNAALLKDSDVGFVGTCTIGVDHLDTEYLSEHGVTFTSAPGCNAFAVVQYVVSVLSTLGLLDSLGETPGGTSYITSKSVVIVGGGNVGGRVYDALTKIGFSCRIVDPFLNERCGRQLADPSCIASADIVCLHTPLTNSGVHPTHHMFGVTELNNLKKGAVLINAGRGGVVDNNALKQVLNTRSDLRVVLDVWENEPEIDTELLESITIGTPHIAGYSFEGRLMGALMIFDELTAYLSLDEVFVQGIRSSVVSKALGKPVDCETSSFKRAILNTYDPFLDDAALRSVAKNIPAAFDQLRKNYPQRREFSHYCYRGLPKGAQVKFSDLGFIVEN